MNRTTHLIALNPAIPDNRRPTATMVVPGWVRGVPSQRLILILRSPGCTYDRKPGGGCSYCGFRHLTTKGTKVTTDEYIGQIEAALAAHEVDFPRIREIDIFNSGNFLNDAEVPPDARLAILKTCAKRGSVRLLVIESRPEFVCSEKLSPLRGAIRRAGDDLTLEVAIGLDAYDDSIREGHLRKGFSRSDFERAVGILGHLKIDLLVYVMLKPCELSNADALRDVVSAGEYVYRVAAASRVHARIALEPTFVVPATRLALEYASGAYTPPSLWLVKEAAVHLADMGPLTVGLWDEDLNPVAVPSSCEACRNRLIEALRMFNLTQNSSDLNLAPCPCQDPSPDSPLAVSGRVPNRPVSVAHLESISLPGSPFC
jgi:radical SAM enzyme (TIGR01210 family)